MELHFVKGKGSRSDLQVSVSEWENKALDTKMRRKVCARWTLRKEFHTWYSFS